MAFHRQPFNWVISELRISSGMSGRKMRGIVRYYEDFKCGRLVIRKLKFHNFRTNKQTPKLLPSLLCSIVPHHLTLNFSRPSRYLDVGNFLYTWFEGPVKPNVKVIEIICVEALDHIPSFRKVLPNLKRVILVDPMLQIDDLLDMIPHETISELSVTTKRKAWPVSCFSYGSGHRQLNRFVNLKVLDLLLHPLDLRTLLRELGPLLNLEALRLVLTRPTDKVFIGDGTVKSSFPVLTELVIEGYVLELDILHAIGTAIRYIAIVPHGQSDSLQLAPSLTRFINLEEIIIPRELICDTFLKERFPNAIIITDVVVRTHNGIRRWNFK